jgi:hypothetical protein
MKWRVLVDLACFAMWIGSALCKLLIRVPATRREVLVSWPNWPRVLLWYDVRMVDWFLQLVIDVDRGKGKGVGPSISLKS